MNKTIFRLTTAGLMLAGVIAFGAAAGLAQDPCTDAAGQTAMQDEYTSFGPAGMIRIRQRP